MECSITACVQLLFYIQNFNSGDGNRTPKIREKENGLKKPAKVMI
jgi:hypothetical protein